MVHGFSRMLQMVNIDILKLQKLIEKNLNKVYNSDDEKSDFREISSKIKKRKKQNTSILTIYGNNVYKNEDKNNIYNNTEGNDDPPYIKLRIQCKLKVLLTLL